MATYQAVAAVCEAVIQLLRASYRPENFGQIEFEFKVYVTQDFTTPMQAGVSLFLYRVAPNTVFRTPPGRPGPDGKPQKTLLPLDLYFLVTIWAKEPSLQNTMAGWVMRCLEDTPILTQAQLNSVWTNVFRPDETVEVMLGELSTQDLMHIWDRLPGQNFHLSIPYLARGIQVESNMSMATDNNHTNRM